MDKIKTIIISVEQDDQGTYWGNTENIPGVITSSGKTLSILRKSLNRVYLDYYELALELNESYINQLPEKPVCEFIKVSN